MTANPPTSGLQFLSVTQAAETLGVSRVKIREAAARGLVPSQRDNENRLRLDLSGLDPAELDHAGASLDQVALMHILFDEIEELNDDLQDSHATAAALRQIADRQADALDDAADRIERDAADKLRLEGLLERALSQLETAGDARLAAISEQALTALEATGDQLETSLSQTARFEALAARAMEQAEGGNGLATEAIEATTERAMHMLDTALQQAEGNRHAAQKTGEMLERALQTGERLEQQIARRDREIATKDATVEKVLHMSERAVALAGADVPKPQKKTFWQWFMRR